MKRHFVWVGVVLMLASSQLWADARFSGSQGGHGESSVTVIHQLTDEDRTAYENRIKALEDELAGLEARANAAKVKAQNVQNKYVQANNAVNKLRKDWGY